MKTQCDRLLEYLKTTGSINPLTAWTELSIYRLSARILDLKKAGHPIISTTKSVENKYGERFKVGCYKLMPEC